MYIVQVQDNGATLNLVYNDGSQNSVPKAECRLERAFGASIMRLVRTNFEVFEIDYANITSPSLGNSSLLYDSINTLLSTPFLA